MTATPRRLGELLARAGVLPLAPPEADPEISGVGVDSRTLGTGALFLALPGLQHNGDEFVADALAHGARAVLSASPRPRSYPAENAWVQVQDPRNAGALVARELFERPDEALTLVGVTGTNGKTTVTYLVESIVRAGGRSAGRIGTVAYSFGDVERPASRTTPEAPELYALLAEMRDRGADLVAMEVSSHALALGRVAGARFAAAAFLNFSRDHLDFHGTLESYFEAKAALFEGLDPSAFAILPADATWCPALAKRTRARVVTFGRSSAAAVRLAEERSGPTGSVARLEGPFGALSVRTSLLGRFNLDNIAAAAACAVAAGCSGDAILRGVDALAHVPGRMEPIASGAPFGVLIDYAHTPDALACLLAAARAITTGRILLVFGCGGERDRGKRPEMGRVAAQGADAVFVTSDNPRGEEPAAIMKEIEQGIVAAGSGTAHLLLEDRAEAVRRAIGEARRDDLVLIAGKGHETTQSMGAHVRHLDDREIAREALALVGFGTRGSRARA